LATCQDSSRAALDPSLPQSAVSGSVFLTDMIGCGFLKAVDGMKGRQWTDPEFAEGTMLSWVWHHFIRFSLLTIQSLVHSKI
jgi:hypothetical protein